MTAMLPARRMISAAAMFMTVSRQYVERNAERAAGVSREHRDTTPGG